MEETKKNYEALVIVSCKSGGDSVTAIVDRLKSLISERAELGGCKEWGKKKLAYLINKESEAYFVLFNFVSESDFPAEFVRVCRITDGVLRVMVVKCVHKKKKSPRRPAKKVENAGDAESQKLGSTEDSLESKATVGTPSEVVQEGSS